LGHGAVTDFLAQKFNPGTTLEPPQKGHTKRCTRHYAKPLLAVGLLSTVLANHCQYCVSVSLPCRLCAAFLFFLKGRRFFKTNFLLTSFLYIYGVRECFAFLGPALQALLKALV